MNMTTPPDSPGGFSVDAGEAVPASKHLYGRMLNLGGDAILLSMTGKLSYLTTLGGLAKKTRLNFRTVRRALNQEPIHQEKWQSLMKLSE